MNMINKTKLSQAIFSAVLGIFLLGCNDSSSDGDKAVNAIEPSVESYYLLAGLEVIELTEGETEQINVANLVTANGIDSWSITNVEDESGLGIITNQTETTFDYTAISVGVAKIVYTVEGESAVEVETVTASSQVVASILFEESSEPENMSPVANNIIASTMSDTSITIDLLDYVSDPDSNDDNITISDVVSSSNRFTFNDETNIVTFNPNGFVGSDNAAYTVDDGYGGYAVGFIAVTSIDANPEEPNTAPVANDYNYPIDSATTSSWDIDLVSLGLISDADGDELVINAIYSGNDRVEITGDTTLRYMPNDYIGIDQFTYSIVDTKGASALATFTIVVNNSELHDHSLTASPVNASVLDNDKVTISLKESVEDSHPDHEVYITNIVGAAGLVNVNEFDPLSIDYDPNGFVGLDEFAYVVSDNEGLSAISSVNVDVIAHNPSAPSTEIAQTTMITNQIVDIDLSQVIFDENTASSQLVISNLSSATSPASAILNNQTVTYSANGFLGTDILTYTVSDGEKSSTGTIVVVVNPEESNLIFAEDIELSTSVNTNLVIDLQDYSSALISPVEIVSLIGGNKEIVTASLDVDVAMFVPVNNQHGTVEWVYTIKDSSTPSTYSQGKIILDVVPPTSPEITELEIVLEEGELVSNIDCNACDNTKYTYKWIINGLVVSTSERYSVTSSDQDYNVRLEVQGEDIYGQITDLEYSSYEYVRPSHIIGSSLAFSSLMSDGTVVSWGSLTNGGDTSDVQSELEDVAEIVSNDYAFAALKNDGTVVTWGNANYGGDSDSVKSQLNNIVKIYPAKYAIAALKSDGTVVTWGSPNYGGDSSVVEDKLVNVVDIFNTYNAFAALKNDGTVVTWGEDSSGGNSDAVASQLVDVVNIVGRSTVFAALKRDGSVVNWGEEEFDTPPPITLPEGLTNVVNIFSSKYSFAALKTDSTVVTWGDEAYGGDSSKVEDQLVNVVNVVGNEFTFAALKHDGSVVTWGTGVFGGDSSEVQNELINVKEIFAAQDNRAFAALREDGNVISWGDESLGGNSDNVQDQLTDVVNVFHNSGAFAALKQDGTVVTWGDTARGGNSDNVKDQLTDVVEIFSNEFSFVALKKNGEAVHWGALGNVSQDVLDKLEPKVTLVSSSLY